MLKSATNFQKTQLDLLADAKVRASAESLFKAKGRPARRRRVFVDPDFRPSQAEIGMADQRRSRRNSRLLIRAPIQRSIPIGWPACSRRFNEANSSNVSTASAAIKTLDQKRMTSSAARAELDQDS